MKLCCADVPPLLHWKVLVWAADQLYFCQTAHISTVTRSMVQFWMNVFCIYACLYLPTVGLQKLVQHLKIQDLLFNCCFCFVSFRAPGYLCRLEEAFKIFPWRQGPSLRSLVPNWRPHISALQASAFRFFSAEILGICVNMSYFVVTINRILWRIRLNPQLHVDDFRNWEEKWDGCRGLQWLLGIESIVADANSGWNIATAAQKGKGIGGFTQEAGNFGVKGLVMMALALHVQLFWKRWSIWLPFRIHVSYICKLSSPWTSTNLTYLWSCWVFFCSKCWFWWKWIPVSFPKSSKV